MSLSPLGLAGNNVNCQRLVFFVFTNYMRSMMFSSSWRFAKYKQQSFASVGLQIKEAPAILWFLCKLLETGSAGMELLHLGFYDFYLLPRFPLQMSVFLAHFDVL